MRKLDGSPTNAEVVLCVACRMGTEFTISDLIVAAWTAYPDRFGLDGYNLPSTNKLFPKIYALINGGAIALTIAQDRYRVTKKGVAAFNRLKKRM